MIRRPPGSTLTDTRFPYTTRFRSPQRLVIGPVVAADALQSFLQAQLAPVDAGAVGDHPRDGAEAGGDARRGSVGIGGQAVPEHRRVELVDRKSTRLNSSH